MKGCFVCKRGSTRIPYVFGTGAGINRMEVFGELLTLCPNVIHEDNLEENRNFLAETEVILATWDMLPLCEEDLKEFFPKLEIVLYAAGSVQKFARPFLNRGIKIVSAWGSMCYPVAQFTVSCIIMANKGAFLAARAYQESGFAEGHNLATERFPGTYGTKVGILGAGMIGSLVIQMLKAYPVEIVVYDPFLSSEKAKALGVSVSGNLEEIFSQCQTISNHIADNERTRGMLDYPLFSCMNKNAAFINTGRGAQVVEADLVRALKEEPARCAILDVTFPEPVDLKSELLTLPNVVLFPHIAGYAASEVLAMADCMAEQLKKYQQGAPLDFEVTLPMLETMA